MFINRKYNNELDDLKKWYITHLEENNYNRLTVKNAENLFYRIRDFEIQMVNDKKIHEFNYEELICLLKFFNSSSTETLSTYLNIIKRYLLFCRENANMRNTIDFTRAIDTSVIQSCINTVKHENKYIERAELLKTIESFINYSDKALYLMIFEGIRGKNFDQIINLKKSDIDFESCTIETTNEKGERMKKHISQELTNILNRCVDEELYYRDNTYEGKVDTLVTSQYVFRPCHRYLDLSFTQNKIREGEYTSEVISKTTLVNRMYRLAKEFSDAPFLTPLTLYRSGLLERYKRHIKANKIGTSKKEFVSFCTETEDISLGMMYKIYKSIGVEDKAN